MNSKEIKEVLNRHKRWLEETEEWGEEDRANLSYANLSYANLSYANLSKAILYNANLSNADLSYADLSKANLCNANLSNADLSYADLSYADLSYANLSYADLSHADLSKANLPFANLSNADLSYADLSYANLFEANISEAVNVPFIPYVCPDFGSFIGFKKASGHIVVLEIPEDAKRLSATGRKCRCNKAKVLQIQNIDGTSADVTAVESDYDSSFIYRVGEEVSVDDFDVNRWSECSTGIHFFINRQEAVEY